MNTGIDLGSAYIKHTSKRLIPAKLTSGKTLNSNNTIEYNGILYTVGEGKNDLNIDKSKRKTNLIFLFYMLASLTNDIENNICVGLPVGQYQADKTEYKDYILSNGFYTGEIKGNKRCIRINDVTILPEGLEAIPNGYEGIIVDVGGRTTDIVLLETVDFKKKVTNPLSIPTGTLNLYSNIVSKFNNEYSLDLKVEQAEKIIKSGLILEGEKVNTDIVKQVMTEYLESITEILALEYSVKSNNILFTGGGSTLLFNSFKKRIKHAELQEDNIFANATAYHNRARYIYE